MPSHIEGDWKEDTRESARDRHRVGHNPGRLRRRPGRRAVAQRLWIMVLCLATMLLAGMALAGNAAAALLWLVCLEGTGLTKYETSKCSKVSGTGKWQSLGVRSGQEITVKLTVISILLTDKKTALGEVVANCPSTGSVGEGIVKAGGEGEIRVAEYTSAGAKACKDEKGNCTEFTHVKGVNLPWIINIEEGPGGVALTSIKPHAGGGRPGWSVTCKTIIEVTDECTSPTGEEEKARLVSEISAAELLVLASFEEKIKSECTQSKEKTGEVKGSIAILLPGGALSINNDSGGGGGEEATSTTLTTSLSGESKEGEEITVLEGSKVKDKGKLSGTNASKATGKVKYAVYSDSKCEHLVTAAGEVTVSGESVPVSNEEELEGGKTYYWQASYSGDSKNKSSISTCGSEVLIVKATAPTAAEQYGFGPNPGAPKVGKVMCGIAVDCATGNEAEQQTDLAIGGRGPGLRVVRSYNALLAAGATEAGPWGFGWTGSYDASLVVSGGTAIVHQDNGSVVVFYKSGSEYTQGGWNEGRLIQEGTGYIYTLPDQTELEFNSEGRLTKETERRGNSNTFTYNTSKQLEKVTDGAGRTLIFKYNGTGQVESVTDPMKHVISYTYTSENLATVTIEGKIRWEFEYGSSHLLKKITNGRKNSTTIEYEATTNRVKAQTLAKHERKWTYGSSPGTETTLTEPNASETFETFNRAGEPTKVTLAKGAGIETTTKYEYNTTTYNVTKLTDPNGHETTYGYDGEGNLTSEVDPNKDEATWGYDKKHNVIGETTPEGETTTIKLNATTGEPEVVERPVGTEKQVTEYMYTEKGVLYKTIDPLKHATAFTYDTNGSLATETNPEKNERKWKDNEDSEVTEETSARGFVTTIELYEDGQPKKITDPLKHVTEYKYNGDNGVETVTDGNKNVAKDEYNEEDLLTKIEKPVTKKEIGYDSEGQMTSRTDGNTHTWEYKRNALEQVTEEKNPLGRTTKKKYYKTGSLESVEDPEKHTTEYTYDESNRPKAIKYSTGKPSEVTYEYNKDSLVKKMTDGTGVTENTWDKLGRLEKYKGGTLKIVEYKYNLDNEPTKITYPNGKAVIRAYDNAGRLESVTDWKSNITGFKYNADSELEKTTFPSGTEEEDTSGYNEADQLTEITMKGPLGATLGKLVYERDGDGQVKKTTTTTLPGPAVDVNKYDGNNRLEEDNSQIYAYDKGNNPTKIEGKSPFTYDEANQLKEGPEAKYTFNLDGQRTEAAPTKGAATTYGYDQAGNLTTVKRAEETEKPKVEDAFTYDGNNLRQTQTINGAKANLAWDTAEELPLILNDETNNYIYGPENLPIEQISTNAEETTLYLHHDQQGSTRLLTNNKGKSEAEYTYNPYGTLNAKAGAASTPLRYDGQLR